jgi:iron complex outermembrane receptor protein
LQRVTTITFFALLAVVPFTSYASDTEVPAEAEDSNLEMVVVTGVRSTEALELTASQITQPGVDNSDLLRLFPGGNRNSNGPMTRISQYRGLFGAQNNVAIDGQVYTSGGPNWMDSPLSSIPQSLTQSVTLYRGLGSVALIEEGLGGIIAISSRNGGFSDQEKWGTYGQVEAGYGNNANSWGLSVFTGVHNEKNQIDVAVSVDKGDDYEFGGGTVAATSYDRNQYRLGYGHRFSAADISIGAVINRTGESGTPALPMDIFTIDSEMYSFGIKSRQTVGDWNFKLNRLSIEHRMNNFTLRPIPTNMTGMKTPRETLAFGDSGGFKLSYARDIDNREWLFGFDGKLEEHDADISNPANGMFYITNFNEVQRDRLGLFGQVVWTQGEWDFEAGLRYNQLKMDADEVGGNLAMMPMPMPVSQQDRLNELANDFNESDRNKTDNQWSGIFKTSRQLGSDTRLNLGLGRKVRSPSYQERYLWLPMEATAGLADGFTYIGDIDLKPETSIELTAGIDWSYSRFKLTPEVYYRDVKNYIQGVPSSNTTANMFAMMMSGRLPLQFANVDAKLYGLDLGYEFEINELWLLRGNLSYVRGKRTDVPDNLYRIAPLSSFLELIYQRESYFISLESLAASKQDKVSVYNNEKQTAGWGIFNLRGGFTSLGAFAVSLGVENILDKTYQDHLGGYNRVGGSDVPLRERLYSKGRNYYIRLNASW